MCSPVRRNKPESCRDEELSATGPEQEKEEQSLTLSTGVTQTKLHNPVVP